MSKGEETPIVRLKLQMAYWLIDKDGSKAVYIYEGKKTGEKTYKFLHRMTRNERFVTFPTVEESFSSDRIEDSFKSTSRRGSFTDTNSGNIVKVYDHIEVAESITRAQKAFMTIELDHGAKFTYNAFMEFNHLRVSMRRLLILSQFYCSELDDARLNILQSVQRAQMTIITVHDLIPGNIYTYVYLYMYIYFFHWDGLSDRYVCIYIYIYIYI
jgi:hypothetical protein